MKKQSILVIKNSNGKPQYNQLDLDGPTLTREYGLIGGVVQGTSHTYEGLNLGKSNEKSPEQVAEEDFDRLVATKIKEGYQLTESLTDLTVLDKEKTFDLDNIPEEFCVSKPIKIVSISAVDKLLKSGNGKMFIKYNGIFHYILIRSTGEVKIYTRRWGDHTQKYPEIVKEMENSDYPKGTLLGSEFCIDPGMKIPHMTAFKLMCRISKADVVDGVCNKEVPKTIALQKKHRVRAAVFAILFCNGKSVLDSPYTTTLNSLNMKSPDISKGKAVFVPKEVPITSGAQAKDLVKNNKDVIEGLVLWDCSKNMEITMNGKPKRCAAFKVKCPGEADVIAYGWAKGRGRNQEKIGSLKICQYTEDGARIDLGTVGGLKEEDRDPDTWIFPCVIEVRFDQVFPDTGKMQFPRFSKRHEDKTIAEADLFIKR